MAPPSTPEEIVNAAYGLGEGEALDGTYTLSGVIVSVDDAFSSQYNNITVTIIVGDMTDKPIKCYRMKGTGADTIKKGDTITVTGTLKNYYGTVEFDTGCTLDAVIPGPDVEPEEPDENSITIDFSDKANRTEFSTSTQVWANGNFVVTNNKGASTSPVGDYANPARFYKSSDVIIAYAGMTKLTFEASGLDKYFDGLKSSLTAAGFTYTVDGTLLTIEFATPVDSITFSATGGQFRLKTITVCGASADEPDEPACEHEWADATCAAPKTCTKCGETEGETLAHTFADATCTAPKTCTVCQATEGEALGHNFADATCTAPKTCTVCQATEGEALGHTFADATCTAPKTCTVCQATEGEALGHTYTSVVTAPTCQAGGYTTHTCACGDNYVDSQTAKVGHVYYANVCTYCNGTMPTYTKWDADKAVVKHLSFDQLYTVSATEGNIFPMGKEAEWNKVAVIDSTVPQLYVWGWIGYMGEFGQFGYQIDCDAPVFNTGFAVNTGENLLAHCPTGTTGAIRMQIVIPTVGLTAGVHTVNALYKNAAGDVVALSTFKILVADDAGANATDYYSASDLVAAGATNATVTSVDGYAHVVSTDAVGGKNDVKFSFTSDSFSDFVVVKYKTNSPGYGGNYDGYFLLNGKQFIGNRKNSDNWYEYIGDDGWHYLVLNLRKNKASSSAAANTDVVDGASLTTVEFVPFDYAGNKSGKNLADEYIDIAYVAFY